MLKRFFSTILFFLVSQSSSHAEAESEVTVMTFNVRYDAEGDKGTRDWKHRLPIIKEVFTSASIIGVQEALEHQVADLKKLAPEYKYVGVGRDDGKSRGEYVPIFYDARIWKLEASGHFWLSDTPSKVASKSWGNGITRMCTWARLVDKKGKGIAVFNTHFDHRSSPSRIKSAELLIKKLGERKFPQDPIVLLGDFNCRMSSKGMQTLLNAKKNGKSILLDSYAKLHPSKTGVFPQTFNRWKADANGSGKIDHVFTSPSLKLLKAEILNPEKNGAVASDHKPVRVSFEWK